MREVNTDITSVGRRRSRPWRRGGGALLAAISLTGCSWGSDDGASLTNQYQVTQGFEAQPVRGWSVAAKSAIGCGEHLVTWTAEGLSGYTMSDGTLEWTRPGNYENLMLDCSPSSDWLVVDGTLTDGQSELVVLQSGDGTELGSTTTGEHPVLLGADYVVTSSDAATYRYSANGLGLNTQEWILPQGTSIGAEFGEYLAFAGRGDDGSVVVDPETGRPVDSMPSSCTALTIAERALACTFTSSEGESTTNAYSLGGSFLWQRQGVAFGGSEDWLHVLDGQFVYKVNLSSGEPQQQTPVPLDANRGVDLPGLGFALEGTEFTTNSLPGYFYNNDGEQIYSGAAMNSWVGGGSREMFLYDNDALYINNWDTGQFTRYRAQDGSAIWSLPIEQDELVVSLGGRLFVEQLKLDFDPTSISGYVALVDPVG